MRPVSSRELGPSRPHSPTSPLPPSRRPYGPPFLRFISSIPTHPTSPPGGRHPAFVSFASPSSLLLLLSSDRCPPTTALRARAQRLPPRRRRTLRRSQRPASPTGSVSSGRPRRMPSCSSSSPSTVRLCFLLVRRRAVGCCCCCCGGRGLRETCREGERTKSPTQPKETLGGRTLPCPLCPACISARLGQVGLVCLSCAHSGLGENGASLDGFGIGRAQGDVVANDPVLISPCCSTLLLWQVANEERTRSTDFSLSSRFVRRSVEGLTNLLPLVLPPTSSRARLRWPIVAAALEGRNIKVRVSTASRTGPRVCLC